MKAVTGVLPEGEGFAFEVKWDGMRIVATVSPAARVSLRLRTTRGADAAARFPELAGLVAELAPQEVVLDGEVVAFDRAGKPSFGLLQQRMHLAKPSMIAQRARETPVTYVVFDVLWIDGEDLTGRPYLERRAALTELLRDGPSWRVPPHYDDGAALLEAATAQHLEGIMAKRIDSTYTPGGRTKNWRKVKVRPRQEFVVGGWQGGDGGRLGQLGSLLVGHYEDGVLRYAGRVGTGFKVAELRRLGDVLTDLAADECPFDPPPAAPIARRARWVRPDLVAEVAFAEWPPGGLLRHPAYVGTRDDKDPRRVVREA